MVKNKLPRKVLYKYIWFWNTKSKLQKFCGLNLSLLKRKLN